LDVKESIMARRSIRKYEAKEMPTAVLEDVLEAARLAPSSSNLQAWNAIVVTDKAVKERLVSASGNQGFVGTCSAYLVGVAADDYHAIDIAIAFDHISLRATELGLGTCWIGDFDPELVREILGIPAGLKVHICMTLGYPTHNPAARKRKKLGEIFFKNRWGSSWE